MYNNYETYCLDEILNIENDKNWYENCTNIYKEDTITNSTHKFSGKLREIVDVVKCATNGKKLYRYPILICRDRATDEYVNLCVGTNLVEIEFFVELHGDIFIQECEMAGLLHWYYGVNEEYNPYNSNHDAYISTENYVYSMYKAYPMPIIMKSISNTIKYNLEYNLHKIFAFIQSHNSTLLVICTTYVKNNMDKYRDHLKYLNRDIRKLMH